MGKRNKLRHARRQQTERNVCAVLEAHSKLKIESGAAERYGAFPAALQQRIEGYRDRALRPPEDWRCRIKSRSQARRFVDLVRFTFVKYSVPPHLEGVWARDDIAPVVRASQCAEAPDLLYWYIVAAQGGSLHKQAAHPHLSRLETHHFLAAPASLSAERALRYAIARAQNEDANAALRVAQSKLADHSISHALWREVARFFARQPTTLAEINDLIDFICAARAEDDDFTLKGRTLPALRRRMLEWHRALQKVQAICGGSWSGRALPDVEYWTGRDGKPAIWRFRQIKTGNDLYREGQRMHHCVASYKQRCMNGEVSIWSLTCEYPPGCLNKGVTLEVRKSGVIVQCRGFANRLPYDNEVAMVKRWALAHGLDASGCLW
jgi:hypothetical protein